MGWAWNIGIYMVFLFEGHTDLKKDFNRLCAFKAFHSEKDFPLSGYLELRIWQWNKTNLCLKKLNLIKITDNFDFINVMEKV